MWARKDALIGLICLKNQLNWAKLGTLSQVGLQVASLEPLLLILVLYTTMWLVKRNAMESAYASLPTSIYS
jgi:hypothetical protein